METGGRRGSSSPSDGKLWPFLSWSPGQEAMELESIFLSEHLSFSQPVSIHCLSDGGAPGSLGNTTQPFINLTAPKESLIFHLLLMRLLQSHSA